jgi:energy-coupling factor transporter ATP-binding protein EcfA2
VKLEKPSPPKAWIGNVSSVCDPLSDSELATAYKKMEKLLVGKHPVSKPKLITAIGAPGSGKSTCTGIVAEMLYSQSKDVDAKPENYVTLDFDTLVDFHPRFNGIWRVPDMFGNPTEVGYAMGWDQCSDPLVELGSKLLTKMTDKGYNIILQSHSQKDLIWIRNKGYDVTMLYIGCPLAVAQRRARDRATRTGMFLAATLAKQDEAVEEMRNDYRTNAPYFGLWVDTFMVMENGTDTAPDSSKIQVFKSASHDIEGMKKAVEAVTPIS